MIVGDVISNDLNDLKHDSVVPKGLEKLLGRGLQIIEDDVNQDLSIFLCDIETVIDGVVEAFVDRYTVLLGYQRFDTSREGFRKLEDLIWSLARAIQYSAKPPAAFPVSRLVS